MNALDQNIKTKNLEIAMYMYRNMCTCNNKCSIPEWPNKEEP